MSDLIGVTLIPNQLHAAPGDEVSTVIEVQNVGRVVDSYAVALEGLPDDWFSLETDTVSLFPGDSESVSLEFHIPPGSQALAHPYDVTVRVTSSVYPEEETSVHFSLLVDSVSTFTAEVRPQLVAGASGKYTLFVTNTGNTETTLDLQGSDSEGRCRYSFSPNPLLIGPGESTESVALVKPGRRPFLEPPRRYDLTFTLTPRQVSERVALNARLEASPYARKWYFPVAIVAILLLAWLSYSVYWFALERDDLTYLRNEKWNDFSDPSEIRHGHIGLFGFELTSTQLGRIPSPPPVSIRGNVTWAEAVDTPPTLGIVVRNPSGQCWGPQMVDRTGEPFHFPVHDGGTDCPDLEYGWLLMDVTNPETPVPSVYAAAPPLTNYCVRDIEHNPVVKFFQNGDFQTPDRLSEDYSSRQKASQGPSATQDQRWTVYAINPHPEGQWPVAPEVVINLKAVSQEPHSWKKDKTFAVDRVEPPHPLTSVPRLQCGWDSETDIPREEGGLEHGLIYVRRLHISHRAPGGESDADFLEDTGHYGCPREREDALESGLRILCGDVTWDRTRTESGDMTADSVFIILRHSLDEEARCWSRVERHSPPDSVGTPFTFDLVSGGVPCHLELSDPEQTLWNLMNWSTFEPARYQGVQPLVKFCQGESGQALFDRHTAVPLPVAESWEENRTPGWTFYILNPSSDAPSPGVTVKLRGDQFWKLELQDLPNTTVGDTPLVPAGSEECLG